MASLKDSPVTVRVYDNTKRDVLGSIVLDLSMAPAVFPVEFQVIDIPYSFILLLGRTWLHEVRALSSSLHRKIKIPYNGEIIVIEGDSKRTIAPKESPVLGIGS